MIFCLNSNQDVLEAQTNAKPGEDLVANDFRIRGVDVNSVQEPESNGSKRRTLRILTCQQTVWGYLTRGVTHPISRNG